MAARRKARQVDQELGGELAGDESPARHRLAEDHRRHAALLLADHRAHRQQHRQDEAELGEVLKVLHHRIDGGGGRDETGEHLGSLHRADDLKGKAGQQGREHAKCQKHRPDHQDAFGAPGLAQLFDRRHPEDSQLAAQRTGLGSGQTMAADRPDQPMPSPAPELPA